MNKPTAAAAIASVLARLFDDVIQMRRVVPNNNGEFIFSVPWHVYKENLPNVKHDTRIRKYLYSYGYRLKHIRNELLVTRFR